MSRTLERKEREGLTLWVYSSLLASGLVLGLPYWAARMLGSGRYRAGLAGRLGRVPSGLRAAVSGRRVVWLHAVSVGEVLAATRLVEELRAAVPGLVVAVSTTTETGQRLARERFGGEAVFYLPLDFAVLMRRYLRVLRPELVVLMESELWPNMIHECHRAGVPLAVVNARVSDRSFPRYLRLRRVWGPLLREVTVFLAQSEETAERLVAMGVEAERVRMAGNLKYDVKAPRESLLAERVRVIAAGRPVLVAGSTLGGLREKDLSEEEMLIQAWEGAPRKGLELLLVVAPRHPDRFEVVYSVAVEYPTLRASEILAGKGQRDGFSVPQRTGETERIEIVVVDTIGDLASLYGVADVAFVGGSLVAKGGHNPLEPARFGVPVMMGPSYENFRDIVEDLRAADGIRIVQDREESEAALVELLMDPARARALGERGRAVFEANAGATGRVVRELLGLLQ